jgi:uncharacterized protein YjdB
MVITATPTGKDGKPITAAIKWTSSDPKIVTVSDSGDVQAVAPGNAVITAAASGAYGTAPVTVVEQASAVSVIVAPQQADIAVGQTLQLSATQGGQTVAQGVTWASSNTQVASVSSSGLVTAVSVGIVSIRATVGGRLGIATITVVAPAPPPPTSVASVTLDRSSASMAVGDQLQMTATLRDSSGAILDGRTITWASSNSTVASVSSTGLVTARAAGSADVTATSEGKVGKASITVVAAGSSSGSIWSNEPSGAHVISDIPWNSLTPTGWTPLGGSGGKLAISSDATAPVSPSNVLQFTYPTGFSGSGSAPGSEYFTGFDSSKELFVAFDWKVSADWQQHTAGFSKLLYIVHCSYCNWTTQPGGRVAYVMMMQGPIGGPYHLMMNNEITNTNQIQPNVGDGTVVPGRWYRVEISIKGESTSGANDGWIKVWIDGRPVAQYLNLPIPSRGFEQLTIDPVWGGVDPTISKTHTDYMWFDHIHVSAK